MDKIKKLLNKNTLFDVLQRVVLLGIDSSIIIK